MVLKKRRAWMRCRFDDRHAILTRDPANPEVDADVRTVCTEEIRRLFGWGLKNGRALSRRPHIAVVPGLDLIVPDDKVAVQRWALRHTHDTGARGGRSVRREERPLFATLCIIAGV